ncbi:MAG: hypothetical protein K2G13_01635 [Muribaculaceae bacterium]|nr:hypothetical protein [Muribaculaceae bacterium]
MRSTIHINDARRILDAGQPVRMSVVKKDGSILDITDDNPAVSLSYDVYTGLRTIKLLRSGARRTIRDCMIIAINDYDVFL